MAERRAGPGAKISGILVEHVEPVSIVGIGLNVLHAPTFAGYQTTSIAASGGIAAVDGVRDLLLDRLGHRLDAWQRDGFTPIRAAWLARAHPIGAALLVTVLGQTIEGDFAGLDADGALLLDTRQGRQRIVAGDVAAGRSGHSSCLGPGTSL